MAFLYALVFVLNYLVSVTTAKFVFAHVVVGDTAAHSVATWVNDITLAKNAAIDAFVLNIVFTDPNTAPQVANAFAAAAQVNSNFKLLFSFDYSVAWTPAQVEQYLNQYKGNPFYFLFNGLPFVTTFEGVPNQSDWAPNGPIRSALGGIYFVPTWTSIGPANIGGSLNNFQGFSSWDMWPNGAMDKTDDVDFQWKTAIGTSKTYMMGVSPWFFHSTSGGQDWVWRGDNLWPERWAQTLAVQPDFVQIVTWNDYGESSYIGPIYTDSEIPSGSAQFVDGFPHEAFRNFLPYYISQYKGTAFTVQDQLQFWYRTTPATGGNPCGVTGNIASQGQTQIDPALIMEDEVFVSALLSSASQVTVQIGNGPVTTFNGNAGINHFSVSFTGQTGIPTFRIVRSGLTGVGQVAITGVTGACTNYNVWVGGVGP